MRLGRSSGIETVIKRSSYGGWTSGADLPSQPQVPLDDAGIGYRYQEVRGHATDLKRFFHRSNYTAGFNLFRTWVSAEAVLSNELVRITIGGGFLGTKKEIG